MLKINNVLKSYQKKNGFQTKEYVQNVHYISLKLKEGTRSAVVGESGSGKTMPGKLILGAKQPDCGRLLFRVHNIHTALQNGKKQLHKELQVVLQDCHSAVNPHMKVKDSIDEVAVMNKGETVEYLADVKELPHITYKRLLAARLPIHVPSCVYQKEGVA